MKQIGIRTIFKINKDYAKSHLDPYQQSHEMQVKKVNSYIFPLIDTNTMISAGVIKVNFPSALLETTLKKIRRDKMSIPIY